MITVRRPSGRSEPTFRVRGFNFVTTLCFIPLRYIINLWVRELTALKTLWKFTMAGIYLEFLVDWPFAHPLKIPGTLNKLGVWGLLSPSGVQGQHPGRGPGERGGRYMRKLILSIFYVLSISLTVFL